MTVTPNMNLVLPDDHGSKDVWDVILDQVFSLVDAHDHTTLRGVKVPVAGLNINADLSWSAAGVSRAITDLRAVDFTTVTAASVAALADAFWVNSVDSNLYWRNHSGSNIQITNGATLNVAAFAGGIGGDYSAVGALELFDDATDSYWFQQQTGAGVRQYARMRSADVDLYEYKANPAAGVPTNRVRLASPASLGASYALTFPAALPASKATLKVDTAGQLSFIQDAREFSIALSSGSLQATASGNVPVISLGLNTGAQFAPLVVNVGEVISAWALRMIKTSASGTITASLWDYNALADTQTQIGATQTNSANNPGIISLGQAGLSTTVLANHFYSIIYNGAGVNGDTATGYSMTPG